MEKYYGILTEKMQISSNNYVYAFKPCHVVEGTLDMEKLVFYDDLNNKRLLVVNPSTINSSDDYFIGTVFSEKELKDNYPDAETITEAKMQFLLDMEKLMLLGIYDIVNDTVLTRVLDITQLSKPFALDEEDDEYQKDNNDDIKEQAYDDYYEEVKEYLGDDFIVITEGDYNTLLELENLEDIILFLKKLENSKSQYKEKIKEAESKQHMIFYINKNDYDTLIKLETADEIKKCLKNNLPFPNEDDVIEEVSYDDIVKTAEHIYDQVALSISLVGVKEVLSQVINNYQECIDSLSENENEAPLTLKYLKVHVAAMTQMLGYKELSKIKDEYNKLYYETSDLIRGVEKELIIEGTAEEKFENTKQYLFDYQEVHDKMVTRIIGRDKQIDDILTIIARNDRLINSGKRKSMIIAGTTGTGKTQTFIELKKALKDIRPVNIVDTNQLTAAGYVGGTIEDNILLSIIMEAHNIIQRKTGKQNPQITLEDLELAKHSIIILDEIDKRAEVAKRADSVNKSGVIDQMLKLMDAQTKYIVKIGNQSIEFDTSDLTIFASGAFQEYFEESDKESSFGFVPDVKDNSIVEKTKDYKKFNEVDPNELVKYGLNRQFIGRFSKVTLFPPHTKESLLELEKNKSTSNLQAEIEEYRSKGISLVWENGFIEEAVKRAYESKSGGRALQNIINRSLGNLEAEVNRRNGMFKIIFLPTEALDDSGKVVLITQDDKTILLSQLYNETAEKNNNLRSQNLIELDVDAYSLAMDLYKAKEDVKVKKIGTK